MTGWLVFAAFLLLLASGGWWWMKAHPSGKCRWCGGSGKNPLSTEKRFGTCRHCDGSGRKQWMV